METKIIQIKDDCGEGLIKDSFSKKKTKKRNPAQGYVKIYDVKDGGKKKLLGKHNHILYNGREWLAQRLINANNPSVPTDHNDFINWIGLGKGGTNGIDWLTAIDPTDTDIGLSSEVPIHATDTACADFRSSWYYKHHFDSIVYEQDPPNGNKYLIMKITITIGTDDANDTTTNNHYLNEAVLFVSDSSISHNGNFYPFSRITFPTIVKDTSREIIFEWYIYV